MADMPRRVSPRFRFEVEVHVSSAWTETTTMAQIEKQARVDAMEAIRDMLQKCPDIRLVGELEYQFLLVAGKKNE